MASPRVVHFEISQDDRERAAFYKNVFKWEVEKWVGEADYWLIKTGEPTEIGIDGGLMLRQGDLPPVVNVIDFADLQDAVTKVVANNGNIHTDIHLIPGVGHFSYCRDSEGNLFGMKQSVAA